MFFNDAATTEIYTPGYTLSLHDALPICDAWGNADSQHDALYDVLVVEVRSTHGR